MKKNGLSINNLLILFLILIYSFLWSLKSDLIQTIDFSGYFFGANLLDDNYSLYKLHFDHKGPFFYFFFKILVDFFKLTSLSILISQYFILVITVFLYLLALKLLTNVLVKSDFNKFIFFLLSLSSLYEFSSDGIISLFQQALIIFGYFFFFTFFFKEEGTINLFSFINCKLFFLFSFFSKNRCIVASYII
jgi:hypothetical protein